ncbi:MAG: hypothetical protein AAFR81_11515 [Chloroflexota bacterium]
MRQTASLSDFDSNIQSVYTATLDALQYSPLNSPEHVLRRQHDVMTELYKRIYKTHASDPVIDRTVTYLKKAIWNLRDSYSSALNDEWGKSDYQQSIALQELELVALALKSQHARR